MRIHLAALLILLSSGTAFAQKEPLKPAPVPGTETETVAPADRAGRSDTSDNAAPFAAMPSGSTSGAGLRAPPSLAAPATDSASTPSLQK